MSGNRGPKITPEIKRLVTKEALQYPRIKRTELAEKLCEQIEKDGKHAPTVETLEKMISKIRNMTDELDYLWSTMSMAEYPIPPEALPVVLKFSAKSQEDRHFLTIREALWVSRLYCVFKGPSGESAINLDLLYATACSLAIKEKVLSMEPHYHYPNKIEDMTSFWLEDAHLYSEVAYGPPSPGDIMTRITKKLLGGTK